MVEERRVFFQEEAGLEMTTYKQLQKEFDEKVAKLQRACKHKKVSKWMEEWWAIAHPTGFIVKQCLICNKEIKRKKGRLLK